MYDIHTPQTAAPSRPRKRRPLVAVPETLHPEQRIAIPIVSALTGWGRSKILKEAREGRFPAPERDGPRCTRWRAGDVLDALVARRAARASEVPE